MRKTARAKIYGHGIVTLSETSLTHGLRGVKVMSENAINRQAVIKEAREMERLGKAALDKPSGSDVSEEFQRHMNFLAICGEKNHTPWAAVAAQMRQDYVANQSKFDAGRKDYDKDFPQITLHDGVDRGLVKAAQIDFSRADYDKPGIGQSIYRNFNHASDAASFSLPGFVQGDGVIKPEYGKDECLDITPKVQHPKSVRLGVRG